MPVFPAKKRMKTVGAVFLACLATLVGPVPAQSLAQTQCRQALALGLDVSGSVDEREYRLQLDGLAAALESASVVGKLLELPNTHIEISVFEWSGPNHQRLVLDWTPVTSAAVITRVADRLRSTARIPADPSTGLGRAMVFGCVLLAKRPDCWSHSLDLSGDGRSNSGPRPQDVRSQDLFENVVVNALVVGDTDGGRDLKPYFEAVVLNGIGSFAIQAASFDAFEQAMTKKLLRELQGLMVSHAKPRPQPPVPNQ